MLPHELALHTHPTPAPPQSGVPVPTTHATQSGPQWPVVSQLAHVPESHHSPDVAQSPSFLHSTHPVPSQYGVAPPHAAQLAPQCAGVSHCSQAFGAGAVSHQYPLAHPPPASHSLQPPPSQPYVHGTSALGYVHAPPSHVPGELKYRIVPASTQ